MKEESERVPLKTILQNFLNHVETLEARRAEGEDTYDKEFQVLVKTNLVNYREIISAPAPTVSRILI
jgi:hypothetical protein